METLDDELSVEEMVFDAYYKLITKDRKAPSTKQILNSITGSSYDLIYGDRIMNIIIKADDPENSIHTILERRLCTHRYFGKIYNHPQNLIVKEFSGIERM